MVMQGIGRGFARRYADVLVVYANPSAPVGLGQALRMMPDMSKVDLFDGYRGTPALEMMERYRIVVTFSNNAYADADRLGDRLAEYVDGGGTVVAGFRSFDNATEIKGRWKRDRYAPFENGSIITGIAGLGRAVSHNMLMAGVVGMNTLFRMDVRLADGAVAVGEWCDGRPAVAYREISGGLVVGLSAYIDGNAASLGNYAKVIANAGRWVRVGVYGESVAVGSYGV